MTTKTEAVLTCACKKEFKVDNTASELLVQILNIIQHLKEPPHEMKEPRHTISTNDSESFYDQLNNHHGVVLTKTS